MRFIILFLLSIRLMSFDFNAPPAKEEVMEPSVLGDEVLSDNKKRKTQNIESEKKFQKSEDDEFDREWNSLNKDKSEKKSTTIYVSHKPQVDENINPNAPKIALLVPSRVIKKYAPSVANSVLSLLLYKKINFDFEVFDSINEEPKNIVNTLNKIRKKGFSIVIAPMTQRGARIIARYEKELLVYIPTVNKKEVPLQSSNILFGGIDYEEQIDRLLTYAGDKIAIFNDKSPLSAKIASFIKDAAFSDISYETMIRSAKVNLRSYIKDNHKLDNASIFLNMPIVKTSLLASQLSLYGINYKNLLLTQIAYNSLLFTLTQEKDREKMYIANSIGKSPFRLKDINLLFGTNIDYSWVNYSTILGVDYIFSNYIFNTQKIFDEKMINNQIFYNIELLKPHKSIFLKINSKY